MTKFFSPKKIEKGKATPNRIYADRFLYEKLKEIVLKKEISILDIGCGSGYVREIFYNLGYRLFYTGVDIKKHKKFDQFNKYTLESDFVKSKIEDFQTEKKFDLIFSISALEHIKDDKLAVSKFLSDVQIHIVPSFWSFFLYLTHGYRRYNPSNLRRLFNNNNNLKIYRLGGFFSFIFHFFFITIPKRIFKTTKIIELKIYPKIIKIINVLDRILPVFSVMYIVINFKKNKNETA